LKESVQARVEEEKDEPGWITASLLFPEPENTRDQPKIMEILGKPVFLISHLIQPPVLTACSGRRIWKWSGKEWA
jgi:hypothetical protein